MRESITGCRGCADYQSTGGAGDSWSCKMLAHLTTIGTQAGLATWIDEHAREGVPSDNSCKFRRGRWDPTPMRETTWKLRRELDCTVEEAHDAVSFFGADYDACREFIRPTPGPVQPVRRPNPWGPGGAFTLKRRR